MTVETLLEEAGKLSAADLDVLVESLTLQLSDVTDRPVVEAWDDEISRRWEAYVAGEAKALEWDEARASMFGSKA